VSKADRKLVSPTTWLSMLYKSVFIAYVF